MKNLKLTYANKKVLITGNTGFKGSWLSLWLEMLGAEVYGFSDTILDSPSLFEVISPIQKGHTDFNNIENFEMLNNRIQEIKPDFIFHLAAQALVQPSFAYPRQTILANAVGTVNILEAARISEHDMTLIMITSDKVYRNNEWVWGYKESDVIGGEDPYSASKGMAELAIYSYFQSYLQSMPNIKLAIARAGNVIGGGDWAKNRIIPDCIRAWSDSNEVEVRNPFSTRPWQHVLEPIGGYLHLGSSLIKNSEVNGESFNFGPPANQNHSVQELLGELSVHLEDMKYNKHNSNIAHEAGLLKLNCDKALSKIGWEPSLNFQETVRYTADWYKAFYSNHEDMRSITSRQIEAYFNFAEEKKVRWISE